MVIKIVVFHYFVIQEQFQVSLMIWLVFLFKKFDISLLLDFLMMSVMILIIVEEKLQVEYYTFNNPVFYPCRKKTVLRRQ